ncbi:exodeoxyribonuclease VII large subunit [Klebsiella variicola subsp. variicola]|nr:exodeoxyribonuclease VII large subunit [Klebsiella variicola subsp. variicola]
MGQVWISGEISNFQPALLWPLVLHLKDDNAQVRCAMFRNSNRRVTFRPQHGQQVLVRANITLYEPRGDSPDYRRKHAARRRRGCYSRSMSSSKRS